MAIRGKTRDCFGLARPRMDEHQVEPMRRSQLVPVIHVPSALAVVDLPLLTGRDFDWSHRKHLGLGQAADEASNQMVLGRKAILRTKVQIDLLRRESLKHLGQDQTAISCAWASRKSGLGLCVPDASSVCGGVSDPESASAPFD